MGFATQYLEKQKEYIRLISESPSQNLKFIVVIPCYNEEKITDTLNSLWSCERPEAHVEVIVVINSAISAPENIIQQNKKTHDEVITWISKHLDQKIRFFVINKTGISEKNSGAGYARKLGMDEAISRFNTLNNESGVIISLDADTLCKTNYLVEIEKSFENKPRTNALTIYFEHPLQGSEFDSNVYNAITRYELYLRYFKHALKYTGFPYPYYTIGSCFAVSAKAYIKQGGMSRKQAGEDFYFLQKIFSLGNTEELNSSCVYPSPRPSDRVPFGTGPVIRAMLENNEHFYPVYQFESFSDLKAIFKITEQLYRINSGQLNELLYLLPLPVADFLAQNDFIATVTEINANSSNVKAFSKRFFEWFNAFRIIKYLNFVHDKYYKKQELTGECQKLLKSLKISPVPENKNYLKYLEIFRGIEKSN
ncbi:MAG: hypothetical protein A2X13_15330 [Bacteroidetes bacterium GWC2_33_15]|nr:MAG: hypothetical protein A2X10_13630 [Bacteroidetes bacterium GWA2_33_15]OFX49207.1 MAG: hypothetical protein A2X13_15330 [Bacteroidetes bacterium GWC2_33_15]OFX64676.1 MAG: hypothetical protein A2X15_03690 [Bacteroidetes bacterium GWB2_32_14]OFX69116.1 MAG: hypothetical protein A2X14_10225 [Bacteroidetes bacterium GWD2_33_33]HAN17622.1 family 2 glycosyl transferase [Bacteroidales bacterium]